VKIRLVVSPKSVWKCSCRVKIRLVFSSIPVWKCSCGYFLKCFLFKKYQFFFNFLKIIFDISASKWSKNTKKILIWSKEKNKKISIFFKSAFEIQKQTNKTASPIIIILFYLYINSIFDPWFLLGVIIFGSVRFFPIKTNQTEIFFFKKQPKPNRNRVKPTSFGSVWFGF
jgi:hypothetical protein